MRTAGVLLGMALVVGCGDDDEGEGSFGPVSDEEAAETCQSVCDHAVDCGWRDRAACEDNCFDASDAWRSDVFRFYMDCTEGVACVEDARAICDGRVQNEFDATPAQEDMTARCELEFLDCGLSQEQVDAWCEPDWLLFLADEVVDDGMACYDEPCPDILPCLVDVWGEYTD